MSKYNINRYEVNDWVDKLQRYLDEIDTRISSHDKCLTALEKRESPCPSCEGSGEWDSPMGAAKCTRCNGTGVFSLADTFKEINNNQSCLDERLTALEGKQGPELSISKGQWLVEAPLELMTLEELVIGVFYQDVPTSKAIAELQRRLAAAGLLKEEAAQDAEPEQPEAKPQFSLGESQALREEDRKE